MKVETLGQFAPGIYSIQHRKFPEMATKLELVKRAHWSWRCTCKLTIELQGIPRVYSALCETRNCGPGGYRGCRGRGRCNQVRASPAPLDTRARVQSPTNCDAAAALVLPCTHNSSTRGSKRRAAGAATAAAAAAGVKRVRNTGRSRGRGRSGAGARRSWSGAWASPIRCGVAAPPESGPGATILPAGTGAHRARRAMRGRIG